MWIKVKNRLPELSENKLVFLRYDNKKRIGFLVKMEQYYWKVLNEPKLYSFDSVSHWQDLPDDPKFNWWDDLETLPNKVIFEATQTIYTVGVMDFERGYVYVPHLNDKQYLCWAKPFII